MALQKPTGLTIEEAVERVITQAERGEAVAGVARELAKLLDPDARLEAAAKGLAMYAHQRLAVLRVVRDEADEHRENGDGSGLVPAVRPRHYAKELWERYLAANYEAADGTRKAIRDFTVADVANLRDLAAARSTGWARLSEAMDVAAQLLATHQREAIRLLPVAAQKKIAEALA